MKVNRLVWVLASIFMGVAFFRLPAQQTAASIVEIEAKAEKGNSTNQFLLGHAHISGNGVAQDFAEAVKWLLKSAEQGFVLAQFELGVCYSNGDGVAKDDIEAAKWWRKASDQGFASAQFNLGNCYASGEGVIRDLSEAIKLWHKAAAQGFARAEGRLGICYYEGEGVAQDVSEAIIWYRKAAEKDYAPAEGSLGTCYYAGKGVAKDVTEAVKWFRKAAEQGNGVAQHDLAACYANGEGVVKDYVAAYKWMNLASAQLSIEFAKRKLSAIEELMTPQQIAEAQQLSRDFRPRKALAAGSSVSSKDVSDSKPTTSGTGFFISEDGFLVTNNHVVRDAAQVRLVTSSGLISAKVVKVDAANDLALLKAEGRFAAVLVAASRAVKLGGTVATVGFPNIGLQGFAPKLAKGEIAALSGAGDDARYFQISVPVQPGNSGGALVDERGNVVGVVSAKLSAKAALAASGSLPENVNYAVKSSYLLSFLESVPEVSAKLKEPSSKEKKFEDVVKEAEQAAVLVLVY